MSTDRVLTPWLVAGEEYPGDAGAGQRLAFAVRYAVLAPSSHNTQPWAFTVAADRLELRADRRRGLAVADPEDRELTISCGAALGTLLLALRHFGESPHVELRPDAGEPELLARVGLGPAHRDPPAEEAELFAGIAVRRTTRGMFDGRALPTALLDRLVADAAAEGARLHPVAELDRRREIARLVAEADRLQWGDRRFRRELAAWMRANDSRAADGIRGYGFGFSRLMSHAGPVVMRTFDLGAGRAAVDADLAEHSPVLAGLATTGDTPQDWLAAGQALQRLLLRASASGVHAGYLNQPIQVAAVRPRLAAALGEPGFPQVLLRLGFGTAPPPEPRRPAGDVTTWTEG